MQSAAIRQQFQNAANDINGIEGMFYAPSAPLNPNVMQLWANSSTTPAQVDIWDGAEWSPFGTYNFSTHVWGSVTASSAVSVITGNGPITVLTTQPYVFWNPATPAATTFTLPADPVPGESHTFKDLITGSTPYAMKIAASGDQLIDGQSYFVLAYLNDSMSVKYAGSNNWNIVH